MSFQPNVTIFTYDEPDRPNPGDLGRLHGESDLSLALKRDLNPRDYFFPCDPHSPNQAFPLLLDRVAGTAPNRL